MQKKNQIIKMFHVTDTVGTSVSLSHTHHTYVCPSIERGYNVTNQISQKCGPPDIIILHSHETKNRANLST